MSDARTRPRRSVLEVRIRRREIILPERTLDLLDRNVFRFLAQRKALLELSLPVKKGLLFYGPPGTGKTHTIRYLAAALPEHTTLLVTALRPSNPP